ncbi:SDR family NAD(P)-dependent oxidoreductase [Chryseobacterium chendengshani]|uniref:SDR family NAD(P)-dependent oxidoreductase n=1 Tax=unclassified Chryseobacterium TaxID=2593645 RepID=UPI001C63ECC9|nr:MULTISPECIES: SDR family NAD(P)-dependent oxidoreductase [unclassified Chryseobacterium]MBW7676611.1 SDR family NAD(P)-dependent oxidoreductase [Chryseobacterium sp. LJ756]MBW8523153.1 SDR family NAD(P)-dependent oxidoreductase [Chryseobacterium sp. LJ668]QYK15450.1 SDR family NAD(P)-dependent oxidoreductase [Chryseobacterium sp. LJ668]
MILVIGASKGIGNFLYEKYKSLDYKVLGTYNSTASSTNELSKIDVTDYTQVSEWVEKNIESLENVTLINCAGITYNSFAHKSDPEAWKKVIDVNLVGTFNCIRAVLPIMRAQKFGRIINFSSVVATKGTPGISAYAASKSALWGMSKSLAQENAGLNITINNINLGYSELGMINQVPQEFLEALVKQIPAKKLCEPIDIFRTVDYLINCEYINGSSVDLNGALI